MRKEKGLIIFTPGEWLEYEKRKKGWFNEFVPYIIQEGIKMPVHIQGITSLGKVTEKVAEMAENQTGLE